MPKIDHSYTLSYAPPLESGSSTSLGESVTASVVLSHKPSFALSDIPTEAFLIISELSYFMPSTFLLGEPTIVYSLSPFLLLSFRTTKGP